MSKHLSQNELRSFYSKEVRNLGKREIDDLLKDSRNTKKGEDKSIFLCHSHLDKTIVEKITLLFKKVDYEIYVDWMDEGLPKVTDKNTARLIRDKIGNCSRFLFLATSRALTSKWCDWELGIAYSLKEEKHIAMLPIYSQNGNWKGSEYLGLYPEMEIDSIDLNEIDERNVRIRYSKSKTVLLETWLKNN